MLNARLQPYQTTIIRQDAAVVAQEVEEAEKLQKEMAAEAKKKMREAKKAKKKQEIEEKRKKFVLILKNLKINLIKNKN